MKYSEDNPYVDANLGYWRYLLKSWKETANLVTSMVGVAAMVLPIITIEPEYWYRWLIAGVGIVWTFYAVPVYIYHDYKRLKEKARTWDVYNKNGMNSKREL